MHKIVGLLRIDLYLDKDQKELKGIYIDNPGKTQAESYSVMAAIIKQVAELIPQQTKQHLYFMENKSVTAVEWLIDWMGKNQYFIGNDLLDAVEKAKQIERSKRESSFVKGFKSGGLSSNHVFDSASESYARMLFNEQ